MTTTITADAAQDKLYDLIDQTTLSQAPIHIIGRQSNAVLISEENWHLIRQILQLNSTSAVLSDPARNREN